MRYVDPTDQSRLAKGQLDVFLGEYELGSVIPGEVYGKPAGEWIPMYNGCHLAAESSREQAARMLFLYTIESLYEDITGQTDHLIELFYLDKERAAEALSVLINAGRNAL